MNKRKNILRFTVIAATFSLYVMFLLGNSSWLVVSRAGSDGDAVARAAFLESYKVFSSARCVNCHPAGDAPLQGENSQPHAFLIKRGTDGKGFAAMRCNACHQEKNSPGEHAPPGAEDWHLPPPEQKMVFEKMSPEKLCEQLKNPKMNGNRSLEKVGDHLATPLVRWAWNPGSNRAAPPVSYGEFVKSFETWRTNGAVCPE